MVAKRCRWLLPMVCLVAVVGPPDWVSAQEAISTEPGGPSDAKSGVTDIEIMLQLREAEKNVERLFLEVELPASNRIDPQFDPGRTEELRQALQTLLDRIEATIASDKVEGLRKEQAKLKKLSVLYEAVKLDRPGFEQRFNAWIEQLLADSRNLEGEQRVGMEAFLKAYRILDRYIDQREPEDNVLAVMEEYVKTYQTSPLGLQLYLNRAENLRRIGDTAGAKRVLEAAREVCKINPRIAVIPSLIKRMELVGQRCDITGPTRDGGEFNIADHAGKVVLVDFWASWCGPCVELIPKLRKLYAKYHGHGLEIVGVSLDDSETPAQEQSARFPEEWPQIIPDKDGPTGFDAPLAVKFHVHKIPELLLVGKQGQVLGSDYKNLREIEHAIVGALGLPSPLPDPSPEETAAPVLDEPADPAAP